MKNEFSFFGDTTTIYLRRKDGSIQETVIDTSDFKKVDSYPNTWVVMEIGGRKKPYCYGMKRVNGKYVLIPMHRLIMDTPAEQVVDHINHNTLDNRRNNLRNVDKSTNGINREGAMSNNKSGIRNVCWSKKDKRWYVLLKTNGKQKYIGSFVELADAEDAAIAARKRYYG